MEDHARRWNCVYCNHKDRQLKRALASGDTKWVNDINAALAAHLQRSHVPEEVGQ
jgi:hypothetical protein